MTQSHTLPVPAAAPVHPVIVRITHWTNAATMLMMISSGWAIHNAYPTLPFLFPAAVTLGGSLIGGLQWHFAAMWLLVANGLIYLCYGLASGRFRRKLLPISPRAVFSDLKAALAGRLGHEDLSRYNAIQRLLYLGVIADGVLVVASGLAIWKPVQLRPLVMLLGDFDTARLIHFGAMSIIAAFLAVHVAMALLVPRSLLAMIRGR
ncbi:thioredoxin reductase [Labrys sp. WJW]|uniref:cytochrome b/b6 domain-containing protein n=1 Tax=Labrys sp. WJW TaxID=1737983 RepID=UPI00082E5755|nr:cytochrome b/b6 domain-containing protein [Labrys sp. WJW]OCC04296.1 thioredoxin reductase [Labrys sp. WJW]